MTYKQHCAGFSKAVITRTADREQGSLRESLQAQASERRTTDAVETRVGTQLGRRGGYYLLGGLFTGALQGPRGIL